MKIIPAVPEDHLVLTSITKRSKGYWGYSTEQLIAWTEDLTITEEHVRENTVMNFVEADEIVAYYSLSPLMETKVRLNNLFILPKVIGKGLGSLLLQHAFQTAESLGAKSMELDADPHAEAFYAKFSFVVIGQKESSIPGRYLPIMQLQLCG